MSASRFALAACWAGVKVVVVVVVCAETHGVATAKRLPAKNAKASGLLRPDQGIKDLYDANSGNARAQVLEDGEILRPNLGAFQEEFCYASLNAARFPNRDRNAARSGRIL